MSDCDLEYLKRAVFRKFPRDKNRILKVSQATKERVAAWVEANGFHDRQLVVDVFATLNERLSFDEFRTMREIVLGLTKHESQVVAARMCEFVNRGFVERIGNEKYYQYRLKRWLVRERKPRRRSA